MLDREFQRNVLEYLRDEYPKYVQPEPKMIELSLPPEKRKNLVWEGIKKVFTDPDGRMSHLTYLREHGLIEFGRDSAGFTMIPIMVRITAQGIDFLTNDGGPAAILKSATVKFDVEKLRKLVEAGLLTANVPKEKQGSLVKAIREAPVTMLQTAVTKMVEKGMNDPIGTAKAVAGLFGITW